MPPSITLSLPAKFTFTIFSSLSKIAFAMFGVYVMLDNRNVLDAQKVFVSMALINILKTPLSQLPFAISTTMQVGRVFRNWPRLRDAFLALICDASVSGYGFTEAPGKVPVLRGAKSGQRLQGSSYVW